MKTEKEFTHDGHTYLIGTVDAIEQFHLFRRLTPLVSAMGLEMFKLLTGGKDTSTMSKTDWIVVAAPILGEMAKMPQDDVNYLIAGTLRVVRIKEGSVVAPVYHQESNTLMRQDLGMPTMLRLMVEVLRHNMADFFPMPPDAANS